MRHSVLRALRDPAPLLFTMTAAAAVLFLTACGTGDSDLASEPSAEQVARGQQIYDQVCSECHTLEPPARLAPPLSEVAAAVRAATADRAAFTDHIVRYVRNPSEATSLMPVETIREYGLMPPRPSLSEGRLADAAAYVWTLADGGRASPPGGEASPTP